MFKASTEEHHRRINKLLKDWKVEHKTYQYLECIFRQLMLRSGSQWFTYDGEIELPTLFDEASAVSDKIKAMDADIFSWEQKFSGSKYGYHQFHFNEVASDQKDVDNRNRKIQKVVRFIQKEGLQNISKAKELIGSLGNLAVKELRRKKGYVKYTGGEISIDPLSHPYFDFYIAVGISVFEQFLGIKEARELIAEKILCEHPEMFEPRTMNARILQDRLRKIDHLKKLKNSVERRFHFSDELLNAIQETSSTILPGRTAI